MSLKFITLLSFSAWLIGYSLYPQAQAMQQLMQIITEEAVLYEKSTLDSAIKTQLPQGIVVVASLPVSIPQQANADKTTIWHNIETADKQVGWLLAADLAPVVTPIENNSQALLTAYRRLAKTMSLKAVIQITKHINKQLTTESSAGLKVEWQLLYLQALQKSLALFNQLTYEAQQQPLYQQFLEQHTDKIYQSDYGSAGWFINTELFWDLYKYYGVLAIGDRIAWAAATNLTGGECEGAVSCYLYDLNATYGKYLRLYPQGRHAEIALTRLAKVLHDIAANEFGGYYVLAEVADDVTNFNKDANYLKKTVQNTVSEQKTAILQAIEAILHRYPEEA